MWHKDVGYFMMNAIIKPWKSYLVTKKVHLQKDHLQQEIVTLVPKHAQWTRFRFTYEFVGMVKVKRILISTYKLGMKIPRLYGTQHVSNFYFIVRII